MLSIPKIIISKKFVQAVGRRKEATAQVRLWTASPQKSVKLGYFFVNGKTLTEYFKKDINLLKIAQSPLEKIKSEEKFLVSAKVSGGGINGQAEAIRHGLSRTLVEFFPNFRKKLKKVGYLTRNSKVTERKKYGLKKARKAPQFSKR
ncbi:30S ribosomal protein S9 [bacterium]|nr:MAG: 30S ribosomal protein S9 [bacterium]